MGASPVAGSNDPFSSFLNAFSTTPGVVRTPPGLAASCIRSVVAALQTGNDTQRLVADSLAAAEVTFSVVETAEKKVHASIAVPAASVATVRAASSEIGVELTAALGHHGWGFGRLQVVALDPGVTPNTKPPTRGELVAEVAEAIATKKSYELEAYCDRLAMPKHPDPDADPGRSKRVYTRARLEAVEAAAVIQIARLVLDEIDSPSLEALVARYRPEGPAGPVKNLIFGSTSKPDLVLADALSNDLALVNPDVALMYDAGIPEDGLTWRHLLRSLMPEEAAEDERQAANALYRRLLRSLSGEPERLVFRAYAERYKRLGFDQPVLLPQVWVHYDPRSQARRGDAPVLATQRMDFLLLLAGGRRIVLEVDGKTHYTDDAGAPSPRRYAQMVRDDRELRLRGYEVYRFGGAELPDEQAASKLIEEFVPRLLRA